MDLWLPNPISVTLFPCFFSPDPWPGDLLLLHADGLHKVILGLSEAVKVAKNSLYTFKLFAAV